MQTLLSYSKPPLPLTGQAQQMLDRGLRGATVGELVDFLAKVSYYRLRGYTYRYQRPAALGGNGTARRLGKRGGV